MKTYLLLIVLCTFLVTNANAQPVPLNTIEVKAGNTQAFIDAVNQGNLFMGKTIIFLVAGDEGEIEFRFMGPLPDITGDIDIAGVSGFGAPNITPRTVDC